MSTWVWKRKTNNSKMIGRFILIERIKVIWWFGFSQARRKSEEKKYKRVQKSKKKNQKKKQ